MAGCRVVRIAPHGLAQGRYAVVACSLQESHWIRDRPSSLTGIGHRDQRCRAQAIALHGLRSITLTRAWADAIAAEKEFNFSFG